MEYTTRTMYCGTVHVYYLTNGILHFFPLIGFDRILFAATNEKTKIKHLNFAVRSLTKAGLASTAAMAHALVLRADVHLESYPQNIDQALEDTMKAIDIDSLHGRAWRVLADVREAKGDILEAMEAVSKWADVNPEFHAKATKELQRLRVTAGGTP